jgi:hypothetical protein
MAKTFWLPSPIPFWRYNIGRFGFRIPAERLSFSGSSHLPGAGNSGSALLGCGPCFRAEPLQAKGFIERSTGHRAT